MKQLWILTLAALCGRHAHAQGTFTFSNFVPAAGLDQPVFIAGGAAKAEGPNLVAAVFLNGVQLGAAAPIGTGASAGYWDPGADGLRAVPGRFSGEVMSGFMVRVWDASKGTDVRAVRDLGGKVGISAPFSIRLGGPRRDASLPADPPGVMANLKYFSADGNLYYLDIPEPSVLAVGVLGAVVMLASRRKRPLAADRQNESKL